MPVSHGPTVDPVVASIAEREGVSAATILRRLDQIASVQEQQARVLRPSKESRVPRPGDLYAALRGFGYCGDSLDRGQIFEMRGAVNDDPLARLGYCAPFDVETDGPISECGMCGARFVSGQALNAHGRARHEAKPERPMIAPPREHGESEDAYANRVDEWAQAAGRAADAADEAVVSREDALAPLRLENSAASRR